MLTNYVRMKIRKISTLDFSSKYLFNSSFFLSVLTKTYSECSLISYVQNKIDYEYKRLCNDDFESCIKYDKVTKNQEIIFMYKKWNIILSKITENNVSIYSCNLILDNVITKEKFRQLNLKITKILKVISGKIKI